MCTVLWFRIRAGSGLFVLASFLAIASACGGGDDGNGEEGDSTSQDVDPAQLPDLPAVTVQDSVEPAAFLNTVEANANLSPLWNSLTSKGASGFSLAGVSEDENKVRILWGQAAGLTPVTGVIERCVDGKDCKAAIYTVTEDGVDLTDAGGQKTELQGVGLPFMRKQLAGHTFDKPTVVIKQGLEIPAEQPELDLDTRECHVISAFGPLWADDSLSTEDLAGSITDASAFDKVTRIDYVQPESIDEVLMHADPFDAVIWIGQTIREEVKTNQVFKPVGMTANAGVFGDFFYDRDRVEDVINVNPLQGPGLMVLVGCETIDDGAGGGDTDKSLPKTLDNGARVVVGFTGCGDARDLLAAAERFVSAYFDHGKTLGEALQEGNNYLEARKVSVRISTLPQANLEQVFRKDLDSFWQEYIELDTPGTSFINVYANVVNKCKSSDGQQYQDDESYATAWVNNLEFSGPFFSGSRQNPANNIDFSISGSLVEIAVGAHFFFVIQGDLGPKVADITLYGNGTIDDIFMDKDAPDKFKVKFSGVGAASTYVNDKGDTCVMQPPSLVSTTSEPSWFEFSVPWKGQK